MTVTEVELKINETQLDIEQMRTMGLPESIIQEKENQLRIYNQMLEAIYHPARNVLDTTTPNRLVKEVSSVFKISPEAMFEKTRKREAVGARQVYVYLLRTTDVVEQKVIPFEKTKFARLNPDLHKRDRPTVLASHIGMDHATIMHCVKTTANLIDTDKYYRAMVEALQNRLLQGFVPMPDVTIKAYEK